MLLGQESATLCPKAGFSAKAHAREAISGSGARILFGLSFVAVLREGIETALFLTAAAFQATTGQTLIGGALGLPKAGDGGSARRGRRSA